MGKIRRRRITRRKLKGGTTSFSPKFALYLGVLSMMVFLVSALDLLKIAQMTVYDPLVKGKAYTPGEFQSVFETGLTPSEIQIRDKNVDELKKVKKFIWNLEIPTSNILSDNEFENLINTRQQYLDVIREQIEKELSSTDPKPITTKNRTEIVNYLKGHFGPNVTNQLNETSQNNIAILTKYINPNYNFKDLIDKTLLQIEDIPKKGGKTKRR